MGAGSIGRLLSATYHSDSFNTSKRDAFILLPCLAIYKYFSIYKLITEPLYLLLEDQRSEISCKRNIKATRPSMERLVYHGLLCMLFSYKFIPNQNLLYGKILPEKKLTALVESFLYKPTLRYTKPIYSSKMGKAASRIYFAGEFQFCVQASGISRDSVTGLIYTDSEMCYRKHPRVRT